MQAVVLRCRTIHVGDCLVPELSQGVEGVIASEECFGAIRSAHSIQITHVLQSIKALRTREGMWRFGLSWVFVELVSLFSFPKVAIPKILRSFLR